MLIFFNRLIVLSLKTLEPVIIGIAGGSGAGKTTLANAIISKVGAEKATYISHDSYYKDQSGKPPVEREKLNYDHPDALETSLLITHLEQLLNGVSVEIPMYDFVQHVRSKQTVRLESRPLIVVEGVLIFVDHTLRDLFDFRIFVDTPADVRLARRIKRDISVRGRTVELVVRQYLTSVVPMHDKYVEPSKAYAHMVVSGCEGGDQFEKVISHVLSMSKRQSEFRSIDAAQESDP